MRQPVFKKEKKSKKSVKVKSEKQRIPVYKVPNAEGKFVANETPKVISSKTYTVMIEELDNDTIGMSRKNDGFTSFELLGTLELIQLEIKEQMAGNIKPDFIERQIVKDKK